MKIICPNCNAGHNIPDDKIPTGRVAATCKKCGKKFTFNRSKIKKTENRSSVEPNKTESSSMTAEANVKKTKKLSKILKKTGTREDVLKTIRNAATGFLCIAVLQAILGYFFEPKMVIGGLIFAVLSLLLLKWKSRFVAILMILFTGIGIVMIALNKIDASPEAASNIFLAFIFLAFILFWMSIRAFAATSKLHGKFSAQLKGDITHLDNEALDVKNRQRRGFRKMTWQSIKQATGNGQKDLRQSFLVNYSPNSRFSESYRTLRTNIHFSFVDGDYRSILVTSSGEQEGKTTTAANLAMTIARTGKSVLLIDADLRKPSLNRMLHAKYSPGLTGLLSDTFGTEVESGSLAKFGFSDLFWLLSFQKKTGKLSLTQDAEVMDIYFLEGEPVDVYWRTRPKEKRLATLLVQNGVISKNQAKQALIWAKNSGDKVGVTLVRLGAIKADELEGYITMQAIEGLKVATQFKTGDFVFKKVTAAQFDKSPVVQVDVTQLYRKMSVDEVDLPYVGKNIKDCIVKTEQDGFFLLPSGPIPPNPSEIIHSARMSFLLSYLNRNYDTIIIDTPPLLPASDALLLASQVDGVLMVVKVGLLNRKMVRKAVEQIYNAQANILGVVLNHLDTKKQGYYNYYYKYYSKYYGKRS